jgi:hypothetical protein
VTAQLIARYQRELKEVLLDVEVEVFDQSLEECSGRLRLELCSFETKDGIEGFSVRCVSDAMGL